MRLRQIGEDLEKIKIVQMRLLRAKSDNFLFRFILYQLDATIAICIYKWK